MDNAWWGLIVMGFSIVTMIIGYNLGLSTMANRWKDQIRYAMKHGYSIKDLGVEPKGDHNE